jgi:hypothetical protein
MVIICAVVVLNGVHEVWGHLPVCTTYIWIQTMKTKTRETFLHWPNAEIIKKVSLTAMIQHPPFFKGALL